MANKYIVKPFTIEFDTGQIREYGIFNKDTKKFDTFKSAYKETLEKYCIKMNNNGE